MFSTRFVLPPAQCLLVGSSDFCLFTHMDCNFCRINTGGEIAASLLTVIQTNNKKIISNTGNTFQHLILSIIFAGNGVDPIHKTMNNIKFVYK